MILEMATSINLSGVVTVNSGPLLMRTYNDGNVNDYNTYVLGMGEQRISSNYLMMTTVGGALAPTDKPYLSSITLSSLVTDNAYASSFFVSTQNASSITVSTFTSSDSHFRFVAFSTLVGDAFTTNTATVHSTLATSSMTNTNFAGSLIDADHVNVATQLDVQTINVSTINVSNSDGDGQGVIEGGTNSVIRMYYATFGTLETTSRSIHQAMTTSTLSASTIGTVGFTAVNSETQYLTVDSVLGASTLYVSSIAVSTLIQGDNTTTISMGPARFLTMSTNTMSTNLVYASQIQGGGGSILTMSSITVSSINGVTPTTNAPYFNFASTIHTSSLVVEPGILGLGTFSPYAVLMHACNPGPTYSTSRPTVHISDGPVDFVNYGMLQLVRPSTMVDNNAYLSFLRRGLSTFHMGFYQNSNTFGFTTGPSSMAGSSIMAFSGTNVGVGTTMPVETLHVNGMMKSALNYNLQMTFSVPAQSGTGGQWYNFASFTNTTHVELLITWTGSNDTGNIRCLLSAGNHAEPRLTILSASNQNGPALQQLQLAMHSTNLCYLEFLTNVVSSSPLTLSCYALTASPISGGFAFLSDISLQGIQIGYTYSPVSVYTAFSVSANGNSFCMQPGGNVGIGTLSPTFTLDVAGTSRISTSIQTPAVNLYVGSAVNQVYGSTSMTYAPTGTNSLMFQSAWGIGFKSSYDNVVRAAIDSRTGNASFASTITVGGLTAAGTIQGVARAVYLNKPSNGNFNGTYWSGSAYITYNGPISQTGYCYYFLPYTGPSNSYWVNASILRNPVSNNSYLMTGLGLNSFWGIQQNGLYSITLSLNCPTGTELFLSKNMGAGQEMSGTGSGSLLALQECHASDAHVSWTGYLMTSDAFCIGFYAPVAFDLTYGANVNSFRNSLSVSLLQATA